MNLGYQQVTWWHWNAGDTYDVRVFDNCQIQPSYGASFSNHGIDAGNYRYMQSLIFIPVERGEHLPFQTGLDFIELGDLSQSVTPTMTATRIVSSVDFADMRIPHYEILASNQV